MLFRSTYLPQRKDCSLTWTLSFSGGHRSIFYQDFPPERADQLLGWPAHQSQAGDHGLQGARASRERPASGASPTELPKDNADHSDNDRATERPGSGVALDAGERAADEALERGTAPPRD